MRQRFLWILLPLGVLAITLFNQCDTETVDANTETFLNLNDTVAYVGMETCRTCHSNVYETYIKTGMGQSFGNATHEKSAAHFGPHEVVYDTINDLYYHPFWRNDSMFVQEYRLIGTDTVHNLKKHIDYVIGSGQHTNSHLFSTNGYVFQAPITYYTQDERWDLAPGFEAGFNSRFQRVIGHECMSCHNGYPEFVEGSVNKYKKVPQGIDCERCHGPGGLHVKQKLAGDIIDTSKYVDYSIVNPANLSKDLQMSLCQRCHLQGVAVLNEGKDWNDFKPGMHLNSVMNVFLPRFSGAENEFIMASQADRLRMSECFKQTEMTCITCHNPHISVKVTPIEHFNNACTNCHNSTPKSESTLLCSEEESKRLAVDNNCSGCHMPKSGSIDIPHVSISDHFIRKDYPEMDYKVSLEEVDQVKQFLGLECLTTDQPDALTMAEGYLNYYDRYSKRDYVLDSVGAWLSRVGIIDDKSLKANVYYLFLKADLQGIIGLKEQFPAESIHEPWTAYRMGEAWFAVGNFEQSLVYYNRAVELMPLDPDFLNKKAAALAALTQTTPAFKLYEQILKLNPDYKEAYANLAYLTMLRGNYSQADSLLSVALHLDPDYTQARLNKAILYIQQHKRAEARKQIMTILQQEPDNGQALQLLQML